jgi:uncharacterized protein (TIGR00369 family)
MSNRPGDEEEKKYAMLNSGPGPLPHCYTSMQTRLLDFTPDHSVTIAIPVLESYCNPAGSMQGGFISAAFDNAFGPLCSIAASAIKATTLYINTTYHRPIFPGDELIITATVKSKGRTMVYMTAEGCNRANQLIASASTQYMILDP